MKPKPSRAVDESERLLTPAEVAALFRVGIQAPGRWVRAGLIDTGRTPGGHYRFRESDVHTLLEKRVDG